MKVKFLKEEIPKYKPSKFRLALLGLIGILIAVRVVDHFVYPGQEIIPDDVFFAVAIVELFFLWFDAVREKNYVLWVHKKRGELDDMKRRFTLITSHELRTPITVIKGYLDLINDRIFGDLNERQAEALKRIGEYFGRLEEIQKNLTKLYSEHPVTAKRKLRPASMEVVIRATADEMMPFIKKRHLKLMIDVQRGLPKIKIICSSVSLVIWTSKNPRASFTSS